MESEHKNIVVKMNVKTLLDTKLSQYTGRRSINRNINREEVKKIVEKSRGIKLRRRY